MGLPNDNVEISSSNPALLSKHASNRHQIVSYIPPITSTITNEQLIHYQAIAQHNKVLLELAYDGCLDNIHILALHHVSTIAEMAQNIRMCFVDFAPEPEDRDVDRGSDDNGEEEETSEEDDITSLQTVKKLMEGNL